MAWNSPRTLLAAGIVVIQQLRRLLHLLWFINWNYF